MPSGVYKRIPGANSGCFKKGDRFWYGKKFSDEHKKHMSEANKGKKLSDETKRKMSIARTGKPSGALGKHWKLTDEHKKKIGQSNAVSKKGKKLTPEHKKNIGIGNTNPDRKGVMERSGGRRCTEHIAWSREVKTRDGGKCKIDNDDCCGPVVAHHILSYADYPDLRYVLNNGITLCKFHHPTTRKKEKEMVGYFNGLLAKTRN